MNTPQPADELLQKFLHNQCTPAEREEILHWLTNDTGQEQQAFIQRLLEQNPGSSGIPLPEGLQALLDKNKTQILDRINAPHQAPTHSLRARGIKLIAAILIGITGSIGLYKLLQPNKQTAVAIAETTAAAPATPLPGGDKATLRLDDGKIIVLDESADGIVAHAGNVSIVKNDGRLSLAPAAEKATVVYSTISTPRGGQYRMLLPDGSKVWLNASSSLRFPNVFAGMKRVVELTGEGYFEIAQNPTQPFVVQVQGTAVEALGTQFNIMAYTDEAAQKTTLLEGKVRLESGGKMAVLAPGQQGTVNAGEVRIADHVDVEQVVAWKNGYFQFERNADIRQLMRQVARWYDVEIVYQGVMPARSFGGKIARSSSLQNILQILEFNKIICRLEGRTIFIGK